MVENENHWDTFFRMNNKMMLAKANRGRVPGVNFLSTSSGRFFVSWMIAPFGLRL
jgi:hypothetical protein